MPPIDDVRREARRRREHEIEDAVRTCDGGDELVALERRRRLGRWA
jgi:hypothetical protein